MAEKMPVAAEPDAQVLKAILTFVKAARSPKVQFMKNEQLEGFVRGFLLQYPAIAKAETARHIIEVMDSGAALDGHVQDGYLEAMRAP